MKTAVLIFVIVIILLIGPHLYTEWKYDRPIKLQIDASLETLDMNQNQSIEQAGYVKVKGVIKYFTEFDLHRILKKQKKNHGKGSYHWQWLGVPHATVSAQGLDHLHHFANSYLIGFEPFETKSVWVPLYTLALRKHFEIADLLKFGRTHVKHTIIPVEIAKTIPLYLRIG